MIYIDLWCSDSLDMLRKITWKEYFHIIVGNPCMFRDVKNKRKHNVLETRSQMSSAQLGLKYIMIHQAGKSEYGRFPQTIYGDIGQ